MLLEEKFYFDLARRCEGLGKIEYRDMALALATVDGPTGLLVTIDAVGRVCRTLADAGPVVAVRGAGKLEWLPGGASGEFAQEEITLRPLVIDRAGTVVGQALVGNRFEAERGHPCRNEELQVVGVAL